mgnify:CR=1 FL=1|jgi:hypothetical protein
MTSAVQPLGEIAKKESKSCAATLVRTTMRSSFPRFNQFYTLTIESRTVSSGTARQKKVKREIVMKKSIGDFFDSDGFFAKSIYMKTVATFAAKVEKEMVAELTKKQA